MQIKRSAPLRLFRTCGAGGLLVVAFRDIIAQREQAVGKMDVLNDGGAVGRGEINIREIPYGLNAVGGEQVCHGDRRFLWNGKHDDVNMIVAQVLFKRVHRVDGHVVEHRACQLRRNIKCGDKTEAPCAEAEVVHQCMTDVARTDENGAIAAVSAEDAGDLPMQRGDIVALALLAEFTEAAEILSDLRRGKPKLLPKLKGRDAADAVAHQLVKLAQVARQTADDGVGNLNIFQEKTSPYVTVLFLYQNA